jgi:peptidoglycan hydrolase CwlO-like protein
MNLRTSGIVVLSILAIAFLASSVHYANKASDAEARCKAGEDAAAKEAASASTATEERKAFAMFVTGDAGTGTAASARKSLGIAEPKTVRAELDSLRAGQDRLTKENADLRQQANATATQAAEGKRAVADAAALRSANEEQGRQIAQLRKELEAARAMAAKAAAAPAAQTAAAPAAQVAAPAPVATAAAPNGPSAYWNGKEWPSDDELRHMMWKYYDTNKVDLEQPLAYKEAEKELRRRSGAK